MKAYILTEKDLENLILRIDRDPQHGDNGGSSNASVNDPGRREAYNEAHRFYNYQVRKWIDEVKA